MNSLIAWHRKQSQKFVFMYILVAEKNFCPGFLQSVSKTECNLVSQNSMKIGVFHLFCLLFNFRGIFRNSSSGSLFDSLSFRLASMFPEGFYLRITSKSDIFENN